MISRQLSSVVLYLLCFTTSLFSNESHPNLDIPANSREYQVLRRIQTRLSIIPSIQNFPQSMNNLSSLINSNDKSYFDKFFLSNWFLPNRNVLIQWQDSSLDRSFFLSPSFEGTYNHEANDHSTNIDKIGGIGATIYGRVNSQITYYTHGVAYTEETNKAQFQHQFNPEYGETYTVEKKANDSLLKARTFNRFENYLLFDFSWLTVKVGRDRLHMGPGYFSSLMASGNTPPYFLLEGRFNFSSWLNMDDYLLKMTDTDHSIQKYANIHRFEFKPNSHLAIAFQDIVIYQNRDPDPTYILPLVPLTFSESNNGGRDNAAMGFDFMYSGIKNFSFWSELFIDDLLGPTTFFDSFWENRWASLVGFQITSPFPTFDADVVVEYSHVEPWTYNGRQPQTSFKHFNVPSASKLGPDSRSLDIQLNYRFSKPFEIQNHFERNEKGLGRQATLGVIHDNAIDGTEKSFLELGKTVSYINTLSFSFLLSRFLILELYWKQKFSDSTALGLYGKLQF